MTDTDNLSRRRFLQGTGAAATAAALAGCTGGDGGDDDQDTTTEDTTADDSGGDDTTEEDTTEEEEYDTSKVVRSTNSTMDTLDPIKSTDTASGAVVQNIFDALTNYPNGQTNVENLLAESLELSDDQTTLTFTLKQGVTYSNDEEVTATDAVYSFERLAASDNSRRSSFLLEDLGVVHETETETQDGEETEVYVPGTIDVNAPDDYTVEINIAQPFYAATAMLAYSSFSLIPEGIVGDVEEYDGQMDYQEFATANPIGAGPYTLETWKQGTEVEIASRDDYHGGEPQNAGKHYAIFQESNPAYTYATVNVNADGPSIPAAQYDPSLRNIEGTDDRGRQYGTYGPMDENDLTADYYEVASLVTRYVAFNCMQVPKPVREAVGYAMNQQIINEQLITTPTKEAYFFTPPSIYPGGPSAYEERQQEYKYGYQQTDLESAKQVLEDAGYTQDDPYTLSFDMSNGYAQNAGGEALYSLLRDQFSDAGLEIEMNTADWSTFLNRARNGQVGMFMLGWLADYPGLDNFLKLLNPPATITDKDDNVGYVNWTEDNGDFAGQAEEGWQIIRDNYGISEEEAEGRAEGGWMIEEAAMKDAVMLPFSHSISQYYSYQWTDSPRAGAMGGSRKKDHTTRIGDRGEHE